MGKFENTFLWEILLARNKVFCLSVVRSMVSEISRNFISVFWTGKSSIFNGFVVTTAVSLS